MARIAIMQPYIFPYIGYFQMIGAVNIFVFYDDVNFIKKGWINRNRILLNGADHLFTVPLEKASQNKLICETRISPDKKELSKILNTMEVAYSKAPFFEPVMGIVKSVLSKDYVYIHQLAHESISAFCDYLDIKTNLKSSVGAYNNIELKKGDRLIDICHQEGILDYVNAPGGMSLYTNEYFLERGINLSFIKSKPVEYKQFANSFVPWLSIIDVAMFNKPDTIKEFVNAYELL
jgi:hypothetical protein